ncbi:hypothetical protein [Mitsuaria sp. 7]|uniref:hypothetical protein n=1 Tax=Mitsuaria sp. 7 TaxID=1658665 RepID=UPI0007DCD8B0|nr:hypothetical protein [Mitsuaria sp. 7]ANH67310.1 hypothetical protein ABE85_06555 [Mitsuaria sp. 7]
MPHFARPPRIAVAPFAALAASLLLTACQSFGTREFSLPDGKDQEVREIFAAWAVEHGLRPCAEHNLKVDDADSCFGGRIEPISVTAVALPDGDRYSVRISVYAIGLGNLGVIKQPAEQLLKRLESLFEPGQVIVRGLPAPMPTRRING